MNSSDSLKWYFLDLWAAEAVGNSVKNKLVQPF